MLTFGADAAQVCDLHEGFREHQGHAGPPLTGVNLQRLQQRLLQHLHLRRLLQILSVCSDKQERQMLNETYNSLDVFLFSVGARLYSPLSSSTSRDKTDGAEKAALRVVHLQGQQLVRKRENLICQRSKSSVMDLSAGQGQPVGEGHGVLARSVASTNPQDLNGRR